MLQNVTKKDWQMSLHDFILFFEYRHPLILIFSTAAIGAYFKSPLFHQPLRQSFWYFAGTCITILVYARYEMSSQVLVVAIVTAWTCAKMANLDIFLHVPVNCFIFFKIRKYFRPKLNLKNWLHMLYATKWHQEGLTTQSSWFYIIFLIQAPSDSNL